MSKKKDFNNSINELNELYSKDPELVTSLTSDYVERLRGEINNPEKKGLLGDIDYELLSCIIISILYNKPGWLLRITWSDNIFNL